MTETSLSGKRSELSIRFYEIDELIFHIVTQAELKQYKETARKRWQQEQKKTVQLQERAWQVARQAAAILKDQFGVTEVIVFGSLARGDLFHAHSDVDLAVSGLAEHQYYCAAGYMLSIDSTIPIDLIRLEDVSATFRTVLEKEGIVFT
jgi:predicted nucleotidyltransferase